MKNIAALTLLFSGLSALTYQVIWLRLFGLTIGMTSTSIGIVLTSIFLSMALGSWLTGRIPYHWQGRLKTFALIEAVIGVSALLLFPILLNMDGFMSSLPYVGNELWFRFIIVFLLLVIPAAGLGATYPLIVTTLIRPSLAMASGFAALYGLYIFGAIIGILVTVIFLIPLWGLDGALYCSVAISLLIALIAAGLDKTLEIKTKIEKPIAAPKNKGDRLALFVLCITGISAVAVQIGWMKYLAILSESSFIGLALLLAIFMSGITAGGWLTKLLSPHIKNPHSWLVTALILLGLSMLITRGGLSLLPSIETYIEAQKFGNTTGSTINYSAVFLMVLPTTLLFGFLFPLSLSIYCCDIRSLGHRAGKGYAVTILAGLLGAAIASMWLMPQYGTDTLLLTVAIMVSLSALPLLVGIKKTRGRILASLSILTLLVLGIQMPQMSFEQMIICMECSEQATRQGKEPRFIFIKEGDSGVVSLATYDGYNFILKNNGLYESQRISLTRSNRSEVLLGMLPHLFNPTAKTAFVQGYGNGASTEVLAATELKTIRVVESEPALVEAMQALESMDAAIVNSIKEKDYTAVGSIKKGEIRAIDNPRVQVTYNDARNTLLMEPQRYDIIISRPSQPWRVGSASLFSREFYKIVHSRLEGKGVFTQWINLDRMEPMVLKSILRAFYEEFPRGVIFSYKDAPDLFLSGANTALSLDFDQVSKLVMRPEMEHYSWTLGIRRPVDLLERYYLMTREEALTLSENTPANRDMDLITEMHLDKVQGKNTPNKELLNLLEPYIKR